MTKKMTKNPFIGELNVSILRLKNGHDVICNILEINDKNQTVTIECPLDIDVNVISGKKYILLSPWVPLEITSENKFTLRSSDIFIPIVPRVSMINKYIDLYWSVKSLSDDYEILDFSDNIYKSSIN